MENNFKSDQFQCASYALRRTQSSSFAQGSMQRSDFVIIGSHPTWRFHNIKQSLWPIGNATVLCRSQIGPNEKELHFRLISIIPKE